MGTCKGQNFAGQLPPAVDEEMYIECNFSQKQPKVTEKGVSGWPLFEDGKPRVFIRCNLMNAEPPPKSVFWGCLTAVVETREKATVIYGELAETGEYVARETPEILPMPVMPPTEEEIRKMVAEREAKTGDLAEKTVWRRLREFLGW